MYSTRYSFWNEREFPGFTSSLNNLYNSSKKYFLEKTVNEFKYSKEEKEYELEMIDKYIKDLEYYYVSMLKLGVITKQNYDNVLTQLKSILYIKMMEKEYLLIL